jgi:tripartite-type tricarboxylate transporter receptor subunit TctC
MSIGLCKTNSTRPAGRSAARGLGAQLTQFAAALSAAVLLAVPTLGAAQANAYPNRPIKLVVTFPPGGGTDVLARLVAAELTPLLGQPVIAENRPGATGNIGAEYVAKSAPDGYTLLIVNSSFAINAGLFEKMAFDTVKDFAPIVMFASVPSILSVTPSVPARNVKEFIALLKAQPGKYAYASCGSGSPQHLAAELFKTMTGTELAHVPYKGCGPALADVVGGHVPVSFNTAANTVPFVNQGKVIALATTGKKRFSVMPNLPTMEEAGLSGYDVEQWYGILAPARTPVDIVNKLNAAVNKVVSQKSIQDKMITQGWPPTTSTPEAFAQTVRYDVERWGKLTKSLGLKVD